MNTPIISWGLTALSYDEDHYSEHVNFLLPGRKFHIKHADDGSHFYAIIIDEDIGKAWISIRGTDGKNFVGKLKSWLNNLNHRHSGDGVYDGFQKVGDNCFDAFKQYLWSVDDLVVCGHSQGAGEAPYVARLALQNISVLRSVHFDLWSAPPPGTEVFKSSLQTYFDIGRLTGDRYADDDVIYTKLLRNKDCDFFNGVDVGTRIQLPRILLHDVGIVENIMTHSPMVINAQMMQLFAGDTLCRHIEDFKLLGGIGKRIVN